MSSPITGTDETVRQILDLHVKRANHILSKHWQWRILIGFLILNDIVMVGAAFRLAYLIRFNLNVQIFQLVTPAFAFYRNLILVLIPGWVIVFIAMGLYNREKLLGGTQEYSTLFSATLICFVLVMVVGFLWPEIVFARGWLVTAWGLSFLLTALGRFVLRRIVYALRKNGYFLQKAIIIGANNEGIMLAEQLLQWKTSGLMLLGFVDKKFEPGRKVVSGLTVLGNLEQLDAVVEKFGIEELVLASSAISSRDKMVDIIKNYAFDQNIKVRFSSGLYEILTTGVTINQFAYVPLMAISPARLSGMDKIFKTILDYTLGFLALIIFSPILIAISILVKVDSNGPIIHRRRVVGLNGRQFDAYKFRTMYVNGNEILDQFPDLKQELKTNHKLKNDPRITKVGKVLRKLSLDELPQIFNVLKGEMSLVGPRMITPDEIEKYNKWDVNLLTVRPGITGLWQVSGRSDISYDERVRLDMYYIRNWNIWLDLQLILQTIPAVIKSRGAY